jgi:hypothetical protein
LLKHSSFDFVLKGRGFKPRRKCHKINPALAAEVLGAVFFGKLLEHIIQSRTIPESILNIPFP